MRSYDPSPKIVLLSTSFQMNADTFHCLFLVTTMPRRVCEWWKKLKEYLQNLNIFPSVPPSSDEYDLRNQRISTILFLFIFSISLIILLIYTSIETNTKTIHIERPSFIQYALLNSKYRETLICPCSNISINYDKFLHVEYKFHQVCSSIFVNQTWLKYLSHSNATGLFRGDFRHTSPYAFQALKAFCELINRTISNALVQFYSNQYISASVIPEDVLTPETKILVQEFRSSIKNVFLLSLSMIRNTTQANALFSALQTNYFLERTVIYGPVVKTYHVRWGNCSCSSSAECVSQSAIYDGPSSTSLFDVPDFYVGCYVIEALLKSSLKCFYDQLCIDRLKMYIPSSAPITIIPLDASLLTRYSVNSTIQELVDDLMIEEWNNSTMYETYYNECQPTKCTYEIETRNDIIYIVTTLFGITGGLATALKLIVPRVVKLVRKKREQQQQQQQPDTGKIKFK